MSRTVAEWIGKTPDTPIPPRVKLRVFEKFGGRCYLSGRIIRAGEAWECDHVKAIKNGGENRENNLAPALKDKHREKTKADVAEKSMIYRKAAKNIGIRLNGKSRLQGQGFQKRSPQRSASRPIEKRIGSERDSPHEDKSTQNI